MHLRRTICLAAEIQIAIASGQVIACKMLTKRIGAVEGGDGKGTRWRRSAGATDQRAGFDKRE